jgi:hypothetical protein
MSFTAITSFLQNRLMRVVAVCGLVVAAGCGEPVSGPRGGSPDNALLVNGVTTATMWQSTESGFSIRGSISAAIVSEHVPKGIRTRLIGANGSSLTPSEVNLATSDLRQMSLLPRGDSMKSPVALGQAAAVGRGLLRPEFRGKSFSTRKNGQQLRVQLIQRSDQDKGPPLGLALFVDGRIRSIHQLIYSKAGGQPVEILSTSFDSTGRSTSIVRQDMRGLTWTSGTAAVRPNDRLLLGLQGLGAKLGRALLPDLLAAAEHADDDPSGPCFWQWVGVITQAVEVGVLQTAAEAITAGCPVTGILCPAAVAAWAAVAVAVAQLVEKIAALDACRQANQGQQGGGGGNNDCYWITWWISYDGGWTWYYYDSTEVCPGGEGET